MQIIDRIREYNAGAKGAKRVVAEFFITNFNDVPIMTLDEISRKAGVSASTVTRVASEMGFRGYPDFQRKAWDFNKAGLSPSARMDATSDFAEKTALGSIRQDAQNIARLSKFNPMSVIDEAAENIANATDVHLLGVRTASTLSSFSFYSLSKIRSRVYNWGSDGLGAMERYLEISSGSVLFVASFPRYSEFAVCAAREVCARGGTVISLTDSSSSPLVPFSRVVLYAPYESVSFFNSMVAPLAVINFVIVKVNSLLGEEGKEHLVQYEQLLDSSIALVRKNRRT